MSEMQKAGAEQNSKYPGSLQLLGLVSLAAAGGWIAYSASVIDHHLPLPLAIDSDRRLLSSGIAGPLNYYMDDSSNGRPLVLLHSVNAAASAYEMRPIFQHYREQRPVYALDLPGFGFSERSNRFYSPRLYSGAIRDFLASVPDRPADVVALSLSSEFAAQAAAERPDLYHSLALISPTGLSAADLQKVSGTADVNGSDRMLKLLTFPLWSQAFFDLLATRVGINYFLKKSFHGEVDKGLASYAYLSSHQPDARHAPLHFIGGKLFTPDILHKAYTRLQIPGVLIYDKDPYTGFDAIPDLLLAHPNWSAVRITPTRGLPQFEQMETLGRVLDNFWQAVDR